MFFAFLIFAAANPPFGQIPIQQMLKRIFENFFKLKFLSPLAFLEKVCVTLVVRPACFPNRLHSATTSAPKITQGNAIMRFVSATFRRCGKPAGLTPQTICV
jgi:hypothetical protein